MSGFSAEWLALREPADTAARATSVTDVVLDPLRSADAPLVVDLGSGTGSNVRYLSPRLPRARWRLVDHDASLLSRAQTLVPCPVDIRVADLRTLDAEVVSGAALVTASALLDLVSDVWLATLVAQVRRVDAAVLWALNYDGRIACTPADPHDELIRTLVNQHQQTDKGFGPALGPHAGRHAESLLRDAGYRVIRAESDWQLGPQQAELQRQLIDGWAYAAAELDPERSAQIEAWRLRRQSHVSAGVSQLTVGHDDVGGVLPANCP